MRIYLRPITLEDGPMIVKWRNSQKVSKNCFDKRKISIESNKQFYLNYVETGKYIQYIVERIDEEFGVASYPIATVYLKDFDQTNLRCELCIFTSDDSEWNTESQKIAIDMLLNKAFNEFGLHKVYSFVFAENIAEIELLEKSGFQIESRLCEEAIGENHDYVDVLRMTIFQTKY